MLKDVLRLLWCADPHAAGGRVFVARLIRVGLGIENMELGIRDGGIDLTVRGGGPGGEGGQLRRWIAETLSFLRIRETWRLSGGG